MTLKKRALIAAWSIVAVAWLAVIILYFAGPSKTTMAIGFAVALLLSELAVYATAAVLGLSVLESRKRVWAKLTAPFSKRAES